VKKVLSISLGSPARDHVVHHEFLGQEVEIERRGTNGDFGKAVELFREYDGKVDAFGVGGIEFFLRVGKRRFWWRDAKQIRNAIRISKVGDGNGVKSILERRAVAALERHLMEHESRSLAGVKAMVTTACERYDLAEALRAAGCEMTYADFVFGLGLPLPLHRLELVHVLGATMLPVVTRLPYRWFYSLGEEQTKEPSPRFTRYYDRVEVVAGDYLQLRSYMPSDLSGKIFVTNTTTSSDVEELRKRNLHLLVACTPRLGGRTFGTNVIEAVLLALIDKPQGEITAADLGDLIDRIPIEPALDVLTERAGTVAEAS
jgi:hypothetical protein